MALHSKYEATNDHKFIFEGILDKNSSAEDLEKLAQTFAGMKVVELGNRVESGLVRIIVGKQDDKSMTKRAVLVRHEKAGWKVQDFGSQYVQKSLGNNNTNNRPGGRRR